MFEHCVFVRAESMLERSTYVEAKLLGKRSLTLPCCLCIDPFSDKAIGALLEQASRSA